MPHIVITLADDTWEDQYIAWHNRVDFQVVSNLTVPQMNSMADSGFPPPWVGFAPPSAQQPRTMQSRQLKFTEGVCKLKYHMCSVMNVFRQSMPASPITDTLVPGIIPLQKQRCKDAVRIFADFLLEVFDC